MRCSAILLYGSLTLLITYIEAREGFTDAGLELGFEYPREEGIDCLLENGTNG